MATLADFKARLRAQFGYLEDSSGTVRDDVNRLFQRTHIYNVQRRQSANQAFFGQTHSLSASQPLLEQTIYVAEEACVVQSVAYVIPRSQGYTTLAPSVTVTTSEQWNMEVRKFKTATYSVAALVATLTTDVASMVPNVAGGVVPCTVVSTLSQKTMAAGDTLGVRVLKLLGGVQFIGGLIKITVDEA